MLTPSSGRWRRFRAGLHALPDETGRAWIKRHRALSSLIVLGLLAMASFDAWIGTCGFEGCPTDAEIKAYQPSEGERVYDRSGRLIGRLTSVRRSNVSLAKVPAHVRQAFVATEDRRFFAHDGVDWYGAARASVRNLTALGVREGFSTITMQLARNSFLAHRAHGDRSVGRKLLELRVARLLEHNLTKDEILERYLNAIYLGNGVYGVDGASRDLFGKRVSQLTVAEGALLAALPKGPSAYTPKANPDRAQQRRDLVLGLMRREGYLDDASLDEARNEPLEISSEDWYPPASNESYALDAVRLQVDSILRSKGMEGSDVRVHTTLDLVAQRAAERAVRERADAIEEEVGGQWWDNGQTDRSGQLEGAMVAIDPRTGDVRALVGGRQYKRGGFNRATMAKRQPGSAFKPFVYAAALAVGMTPASMVDDEPVEVRTGRQVWAPSNYGDEYQGRVTLRKALMHSSNAATVRVSRSVGERRVVDVAHRSGIHSPIAAVPAVALGAVEVTPLELVTAYAPFANGGYRVTPRLVRRIEGADGKVIWTSHVERDSVMDARDAYQLTSMLRSVVDHGTGHAVRGYGITGPVAGKTGTTNDGQDVWFVGYTPTLVAGFWFGYDTPRSLGSDASGGRLAAPAWAEFVRDGWRERASERAWAAPSGMVMAEIDSETGELAGEWCPHKQREWFKPGTEPTQPCREHAEGADQEWQVGHDEIDARVKWLLKKILRGARGLKDCHERSRLASVG
ncbi:MAG: PBP1A family penicillin-binding protein [Gemmatimonadaceae bacterium]